MCHGKLRYINFNHLSSIIFRRWKIVREAGKQEILQQMLRKF